MKERKMNKAALRVGVLLLFLTGIALSDAGAANFGYRMKITVNPNQVQSGPLTNFPYLFSTTSDNLKATENGGHVTSSNGYDIVFRALDDTTCGGVGTSPCTLSHEIERYDGSTGQFIAWVKIPSINNGSVLYIYYGNNSITVSKENKTDVWGNDYGGVWHMAEAAGPYADSTINGNDSTGGTYPTQANGKIWKGQTFNGSQDITIPFASSLDVTTTGTVSLWFNPSNVSPPSVYYDLIQMSPTAGYTFFFGTQGSQWQGMWYGPQNVSSNCWSSVANPSMSTGTWYKIDGVTSGGQNTIYINGNQFIGALSSGMTFSNNTTLQICTGEDGHCYGTVEDVRVSTTQARSAGWIATEYNNQSSPSDFYTLAAEESNPPTLITLVSFDVYPEQGDARIEWQTKSEVENLGFNLYRTSADGTGSVKLNASLIPGLVSSAIGKAYTYVDTGIRGGSTVCYTLEDIDLHEQSTYHGPACANWPGPQKATQLQEGAAVQNTADVAGPGGLSAVGDSFAGAVASGAQQVPVSTGAVTAVTMRSMTARKAPEGVLVEWQTGLEVRNLGFYVYRDEGGRRVQLNDELLLGSALLAGAHTVLRSGHAYSWFDAGYTGGATYWVEDVDLSGARNLHGPLTPTVAQGPFPAKKIFTLSQMTPAIPDESFRVGRRLLGASPDFPGGPNPVETQWALAGISTMKLLIRSEGFYYVSFTQLAQAGFSVRRPGFLQLYVDGKEQPILVTPTGIEFYATGVDTQWTDTRVYWLVHGLTPGRRIEPVAAGFGYPGPTTFSSSVVAKPRVFYFPALLNGDASNFFGTLINETTATVPLSVAHLARGDAHLDVLLQGVVDGSHGISVSLNGSSLGNVIFSGQVPGHALFPIAESQLIEGINQVSLTSSGPYDVAAVDTLTLTYTRTYAADGDHLRCTAPGGTIVTLTGFTRPVRIFDVTDPQTVREVPAAQGQNQGLRIRVPGTGQRTLFAVTESALMAPQLTGNIPSDWHAPHRADLVVITHEDFKQSLAPLIALRQQQGLSVAVVDVEDLYDEFSFGQKTPYAIKAFLLRARNWRRPPRYVLLAGGATYDPRNYLGAGMLDLVPTKLLDTTMIETASDDWFVDFDNNGQAEVPIGRLPVNTAQEAANIVAKLVRYERGAPATKALYVADVGDATDNFEGAIIAMEPLISLVPEELFRSKLGENTKPALLAGLAEGVNLVTYLGHGSVGLWDDDVLDTTSAEALNNNTYPFFVALTCLNGYFIIPAVDSLAVSLTNSSGGAVGVIASSSLTQFAPQAMLGGALLSNFSTRLTAGEALVAAKQMIDDPDVRKSYILFGDPSMRVRR